MSDLLLCPFCGGEASAVLDPSHSTGWDVGCFSRKCDVEPHVWAVHLATAEMQWNTRTVQAQIVEVQPDLLEEACIAAHNAYEQAAHEAGWITNLQSRKPWADVPEANKIAMRAGIAAAIALIRKGDQQ